jgi:hypothetical protein
MARHAAFALLLLLTSAACTRNLGFPGKKSLKRAAPNELITSTPIPELVVNTSNGIETTNNVSETLMASSTDHDGTPDVDAFADDHVTADSIDVDDAEQFATQKKPTLDELVKSASWLLKKASTAVSIWSKANNIKIALNETKAAVGEAKVTMERMGSKLLHIQEKFATSGLKAFLTMVTAEEVDFDSDSWTDLLGNDTDLNGQMDFYDALEAFRSLSSEFDDLTKGSQNVVKVLQLFRSITDDLKDLTDELVNLSIVEVLVPLEDKVQLAAHAFEDIIGEIKERCDNVQPIVESFAKNVSANIKRAAKDEVVKLFGSFVDIETVYTQVVKPLVLQMVEVVDTLYEAARKFRLPIDAPESAADESVSRWKCAWRNTRMFRSLDNVDIAKTMACEKETTFGRYKCWCIGKSDCFVRTADRAEPQTLHRCFRKIKDNLLKRQKA